MLKYFEYSNFDTKDEKGKKVVDSGKLHMKRSTLSLLERLRERSGIALERRVTSGYRDPVHNARVGGSKNSAHLRGYAVDLHFENTAEVRKLFMEALKSGFRRIGLYATWIHLDNDPSLNEALWHRGFNAGLLAEFQRKYNLAKAQGFKTSGSFSFLLVPLLGIIGMYLITNKKR